MKRRAAAWAPYALALAAAVLIAGRDDSGLPAHYETYGEMLVHALPLPGEDPAYRMPLGSLAAAAAGEAHAGPSEGVQRRLALAVSSVYAFGAASLLGAPAGAAAAALASAWMSERADWVQALYGAALMLVAAALVARARRPGAAESLALGAAIGASLLLRSPLFLFPAVLLAWERAVERRPAGPPGEALALWGPPALLLAPWVVMNYAAHGRLILFESTAANDNVIAAALGFVRTYEGDAGTLLPPGLSPSDSAGVLAWAAGEVLAHPSRYLAGLAGRLAYFFSLHPALLLAAAFAAWRGRKDPAVRALALLAAYFVAIHLLFAVDDLFFQPLWAVLAVLAATLVPDLAPAWPWPRPAPAALAAAARGGAAAAAALALLTGALCLRYGAAVRSGETAAGRLESLGDAVAGDPFLAHARGDIRRRAGDLAGAAADYAAAARGGRKRDSAEVKRRWLEALARPSPSATDIARVRFDRAPRHGDFSRVNAPLLRALAASRAGKRREALRHARDAVARHDAAVFVRGRPDARTAELAEALRASRRYLLEAAADAAAGRPRREQEALFALLDEVLGRPPDFAVRRDDALLDAAWRDLRAGAAPRPETAGGWDLRAEAALRAGRAGLAAECRARAAAARGSALDPGPSGGYN